MRLWRISNRKSLAGEGGLRTPGRWHSRGQRIVYCASSPAAALLEVLVHLEVDLQGLPVRYRLFTIEAPADLRVDTVPAGRLPPDWPSRIDTTRAIGDDWLADGSTPLLRVPSAIVPETVNFLLNPAHPAASRVVIVGDGQHVIDPRLLT